MNLISVLKVGAAAVALIFAYWLGLSHGKNSEELKNARLEISALNAALKEFKTKRAADAVAMADLRIAESRARDESERMRRQLADIERMFKTDSDRQRNRYLSFGIRCQDTLERATGTVKFCTENHRQGFPRSMTK